MKSNIALFKIIILFTVFINLSCYENSEKKSIVNINIGNNNTRSNFSAKIPADIGDLTINLSGDGIENASYTYPSGTSTVTLEFEGGGTREIEVLAEGGSITYRAFDSRNYTGGITYDLQLSMSIYETALIIPDMLNNRVVQIDDISGAGWQVIDNTLIGFSISSYFRPYDVDIDRFGRIYISSYAGGSGGTSNTVIRMDDFSGTNMITFGQLDYDGGVQGIAVDKVNDIIYYSFLSVGSQVLQKSNLNGTSPVTMTINSGVETIQTINGMDIDDNGILYVAGTNVSGFPRVFRYNTGTQTVTHVYSTNLSTALDVLYKDNSVYIANQGGADGYKIIKLDSATLSVVQGTYGNGVTTEDRTAGNFYNPRHFVALRNREITIIDEDDSNLNKLVSIDDIFGTNWNTLKAADVSQSPFEFYYLC